MLYLISTPIGNLEDITVRALSILSSCDLILCEDTRKSQILLHHYHIQKPLQSFHKFNERQKQESLLQLLRENKEIALISDGGTPLLCDPGFFLVQEVIREKIPFTAIPGPSSVMNALLLSGLPTIPFQFVGFLPKKQGEKETLLKRMLSYHGTSLAFESPQRIVDTLRHLHQLEPQRSIALLREMTKKFEESLRGTPQELLDHTLLHPPLGEIVLAMGEGPFPLDSLPVEEVLELLQEFHGLSLREALTVTAKVTHSPKKKLYEQFRKKP